MKISIITSLYRCEKYIESFCGHIVNQTAWPESELIILLVDGSQKERDVVRNLARQYGSVRTIEVNGRCGIYEAWNRCIALSSGEYITNANVDDVRLPWATERMAIALDRDPTVDVVYGRYLVTNQYALSATPGRCLHRSGVQ